jgi:hypothetical protein
VVGCIHQDTAYFSWGGFDVSDSTDSHETLTFVVRLWRESRAPHAGGRWQGRVEHVASQEVGYVEDAAGVARFIERWTGEPGATARTGVPR